MAYISLEKNTPSSRPHNRHFWFHVFLFSSSVLLAVTVVVLFPAFHFGQLSLPATDSLKETQRMSQFTSGNVFKTDRATEYVNFIVVAFALLISWLLSRCLA